MASVNRVVHKERRVLYWQEGSTQQRFHLFHSLVEAYENRSGNDAVAYIVFDDFRNMREPHHVAVVQAVPGIDAHTKFVRELSRLCNRLDFSVGFFRAFGIRVAAGMEFDEVG